MESSVKPFQHELKIHPQYYCRVADGSKTFEVRKNDRGFQPGDTVILKEWDPEKPRQASNPSPFAAQLFAMSSIHGSLMTEKGDYTENPPLYRKIGYVLPLDADRVVFSLLPMEDK